MKLNSEINTLQTNRTVKEVRVIAQIAGGSYNVANKVSGLSVSGLDRTKY